MNRTLSRAVGFGLMLAIGGVLVLALLERVLATPRSPEAELIGQPAAPVPV